MPFSTLSIRLIRDNLKQLLKPSIGSDETSKPEINSSMLQFSVTAKLDAAQRSSPP